METILLTESDLLIDDLCDMLFDKVQMKKRFKTTEDYLKTEESGIIKMTMWTYESSNGHLVITYETLKSIYDYIPETKENIIRGFVLWFSDRFNKKISSYTCLVSQEDLEMTITEYYSSISISFSGATIIN